MIEKTYNVGIYCRLSNDDERDGESVSIENQKLLLQSYVRQRGWNEIAVYCDDGYSGTNFDRPGVKCLIEDAKAKKINLILVKDLSRFGRNYIEFGQYTDYLFPSLGCRFIALNNGIDTMSDNGSTDVMCFLNLFNEFYSRDTSKKVKAVKRACAESGKFMGTYPAYGYKRDPEDKHHLVIDEETAPTVRRIFAMRAAGTGFRAIAVTLNEEGVLPPGALYYQRKGRSDPRNVNHKWAETTVKALIRSEVYIGNMVQGKTGTLSYKSRKLINKPEEEWIRVEGTHEPIISREVWDTVVSIDKKKVRKTPPTDGIRKNDVILRLWVHKGGNISFGAPAGASVFHIFSVLFGVLAFDIYRKSNRRHTAKTDQKVNPSSREKVTESKGETLGEPQHFHRSVGAGGKSYGLAQLGRYPKEHQIR